MPRIPSLLVVALVAAACGSNTSQAAPAKKTASPASGAASAADPKTPVAKYEGGTITSGELDEFAKDDMKKLEDEHEQRVFELRKAKLDELVMKRLFEDKAKKEGMPLEQYLQKEINASVTPPTEAEMQADYKRRLEQSKAQIPPYDAVKDQIRQELVRQGNKNPTEKDMKAFYEERTSPPYDKVKDQLRQVMMSERQQNAASAYLAKARSDAKVQVLLQPKRVEVAAEGPSKGPATAPVTIVEFSDFQCPFCVRAEATVQEVMKAYDGKVRLVYRDFPLPGHPQAQKAAEAAHCAGEQNKYWDMHTKLFANQKALEVPALKNYAKELGLDTAKFDKCLDSGTTANLVAQNKKAGEAVGVSGTPAFFINGVMISGAQPFDAFKQVIDQELASRGQPTAQK